MKNAFIELLKVKSILSLIVISVTSYLAVVGLVDPATWMGMATAIVTYYFTRKE